MAMESKEWWGEGLEPLRSACGVIGRYAGWPRHGGGELTVAGLAQSTSVVTHHTSQYSHQFLQHPVSEELSRGIFILRVQWLYLRSSELWPPLHRPIRRPPTLLARLWLNGPSGTDASLLAVSIAAQVRAEEGAWPQAGATPPPLPITPPPLWSPSGQEGPVEARRVCICQPTVEAGRLVARRVAATPVDVILTATWRGVWGWLSSWWRCRCSLDHCFSELSEPQAAERRRGP